MYRAADHKDKHGFLLTYKFAERRYVYKILNIIDGGLYVGVAKNVKRRMSVHISTLRHNCHKNQLLQNAFNKYGEENFRIKLVKEKDLNHERNLIIKYKKNKNVQCYNVATPFFTAGKPLIFKGL